MAFGSVLTGLSMMVNDGFVNSSSVKIANDQKPTALYDDEPLEEEWYFY